MSRRAIGRYVLSPLSSPAAGSDFTWEPSNSEPCTPLSLIATLTTTAAVVNRFPHFKVKDTSGNVVVDMVSRLAVAASSVQVFNLVRTSGTNPGSTSGSDGTFNMPMPDLKILPGWTIAVTTTGLQTTDQWSSIFGYADIDDEQDALAHWEKIARLLGQ